MGQQWKLTFQVFRKKGDEPSSYDEFVTKVRPDEYVIDPIERIWAMEDRSLVFAHACHHSTCGACGMLVNGIEKLTCITTIRDVAKDGDILKIDPLRHFPVISDVVVDMGEFYGLMEQVSAKQVVAIQESSLDTGIHPPKQHRDDLENLARLSDCIECGLCISACPIVGTSDGYLGPAILAAVQEYGLRENPGLIDLVDHQDGVWRCHGIHECTEVCPSNVQPAWRIMELRKQIVKARVRKLVGLSQD